MSESCSCVVCDMLFIVSFFIFAVAGDVTCHVIRKYIVAQPPGLFSYSQKQANINQEESKVNTKRKF